MQYFTLNFGRLSHTVLLRLPKKSHSPHQLPMFYIKKMYRAITKHLSSRRSWEEIRKWISVVYLGERFARTKCFIKLLVIWQQTPMCCVLITSDNRYCEKYRNFTWFPGMEMLRKGSFRIVLGKWSKTMQNLCLSAKFPHLEIGWNYGIFRSEATWEGRWRWGWSRLRLNRHWRKWGRW